MDRGADGIRDVVVRCLTGEDGFQVLPLKPVQDQRVANAPFRQDRRRVVHDFVVVPPVDGRWRATWKKMIRKNVA